MNIVSLKAKLELFPYYTKQNLSLSLGNNGENLNYWIKKLLKQNILIPLKKGLYVSSFYLDKVKERKQTESYLEYLASVIRFPSYVSLEYALSKYGIIPEAVYTITSVSQKTTRDYKSPITSFSYRTLKESLYTGFAKKIYLNNTYQIATPSKALFDYLYLKPFIDAKEINQFLLNTGRINWQILDLKAKQQFHYYVEQSGSKKMKTIFSFLKSHFLL
ncbi:hypothetical protein COY90_04855 [Candidatus Roizmanbacteria bacterium CG_4_10_14_0_8_um_filter_39_9]|uniref:AbiEi antitoxin C-terminal domain-containing protein n=1 Tax=Candidatus Roizmanbacteria bacterium CG_4_10_14_0_8_um_filter_39_9 TaxID=1974829 RepID=A0A2M7QCZ8_9BACT|nr:MAG: hypothetical protein COY90_04855 [Candidatus Roizmanbacteria bacterium CG_4_10_14_0_8_um_filter_39_9]